MTQPGIDAHSTSGNPMFGIIGGGHSAVYGPDGRRLTKPIPADQEGFVYAELEMDRLVSIRHFADPVGHYSRPELLWLGVDRREKRCVRYEGEGEEESSAEEKGDIEEWEGVGVVREGVARLKKLVDEMVETTEREKRDKGTKRQFLI
jgi:nitrilase